MDDTLIRDYQATRLADIDRSVLCHAPFTSLNFDQLGRCRVCCYNWQAVLGTWPEMSVAEMWEGAQATALRRSFMEGTHSLGCDLCFDQLRARNFGGTLMKGFDRLALTKGYVAELRPHAPRVIEFELSNTCNLECIQCQGKWSSMIRRNREHLPPLPASYDERFVEQLEPYLPHLLEARFLGGEPMLIRLYHLIWERLRLVNPNVAITITTNGTEIPDRAFDALSELRAYICLSIDSLDPENYARIRKHGSLDAVLANFERWSAYTRERGTSVSISVCPMTYNWRDLPAFLPFAARHHASLWFNTVVRPWAASLASLPHEELEDVAAYLETHQPAADNPNAPGWSGVIGQVKAWRDTRRQLDERFPGFVSMVRSAVQSQAALLDRDEQEPVAPIADAVVRLIASSWLDPSRSVAHAQAGVFARMSDAPWVGLLNDALEQQRAVAWTPAADRELSERLLQMTPLSSMPGEQPAAQMVLLRVLVLLMNTGLLVASGPAVPAPVHAERLATDLRDLERFLHLRPTGIDWEPMWSGLAFARWELLAEWVTGVLDAARAVDDDEPDEERTHPLTLHPPR